MDTDNLKLMLQLAARLGASGHAVAVDNLISLIKAKQDDQHDEPSGHVYPVTSSAEHQDPRSSTQTAASASLDRASCVDNRAYGRYLWDLERELLSSSYYQTGHALPSAQPEPHHFAAPERLGPVFPGPPPFLDHIPSQPLIVKDEINKPAGDGAIRDLKRTQLGLQEASRQPSSLHFPMSQQDPRPLDLSQTMRNHFLRVNEVPIPTTVSNIMNLPGRSRDRFVERALSTCNYVNRLERQFLLRQENSGPGRKFSDHFRQAIFCVPTKDCRLPKFTKLADDIASRDLLAHYQSVGCGFPAGCINEVASQYRKINIPTLLSEKDFQLFLQRLYPRYSSCLFDLFIITKCRSLLPADTATPIWLKSIKYQGVLIVIPKPDDAIPQDGHQQLATIPSLTLPLEIDNDPAVEEKTNSHIGKSDQEVLSFFQTSLEAGQERVKSILRDHSLITDSLNHGQEVCPLSLRTLIDVFLLEVMTTKRHSSGFELFQQLPVSGMGCPSSDWTWTLMTDLPVTLYVRGYFVNSTNALPGIDGIEEMIKVVTESDTARQERCHCLYALFKSGPSQVGVKLIDASELRDELTQGGDVNTVWDKALSVTSLASVVYSK